MLALRARPRFITSGSGRIDPLVARPPDPREFDCRFLPTDVLLLAEPGEAGRRLATLVPFTSGLEPQSGRATAYVCVNAACRLPTTDPAVLAKQLDRRDDPTSSGASA